MKKLTSKQLKEDICTSLEPCKYTREEIIEKLTDEDIEYVNSSDDNEYLYSILTQGVKGYNNMSLTELKERFNEVFEEQI